MPIHNLVQIPPPVSSKKKEVIRGTDYEKRKEKQGKETDAKAQTYDTSSRKSSAPRSTYVRKLYFNSLLLKLLLF